MLDEELIELEKKMAKYDKKGNCINPEWFNDVTLDMIHCNCPHKDKFEQLFDKEDNNTKAMIWTNCKHTALAAAKRQMKAAPVPDPAVADDFIQHSMQIINKEVGEDLTHFKYSVKDWYDHLNQKKQQELTHVINYYRGDISEIPRKELNNIIKMEYTGILKEELQGLDGKPRMVCSIPQRTKYIMGPITWTMEEIFQDKLQGYCGGQNLDQMAEKINKHLMDGFTKIVEGDGSAFDNTQDVSLKELDRLIYQKVLPSVYHVPKQDFVKVSQAKYKTMKVEYMDGKKKKDLLKYKILGTVFSGDCDTTLMNTTRMVMYNRYVNDKAGLRINEDYVVFSKGDDFSLMYKPNIPNDFISDSYYKYFLSSNPDPSDPKACIYGLGQVLKFLEFGDASTFKFCSLNSWFKDASEQTIYLTRNIKKFADLGLYSRKTKAYNIPQKILFLRSQATALNKSYKGIKLFDTMANMYMILANKLQKDANVPEQLLQHMTKKQEQKEYITALKHSMHQNYFTQMEKVYTEFIAHRHTIIKIKENYWETMQHVEKIHTEILDEKTADYISQQIETELSIHVLKAMYDVGPKQKF